MAPIILLEQMCLCRWSLIWKRLSPTDTSLVRMVLSASVLTQLSDVGSYNLHAGQLDKLKEPGWLGLQALLLLHLITGTTFWRPGDKM